VGSRTLEGARSALRISASVVIIGVASGAAAGALLRSRAVRFRGVAARISSYWLVLPVLPLLLGFAWVMHDMEEAILIIMGVFALCWTVRAASLAPVSAHTGRGSIMSELQQLSPTIATAACHVAAATILASATLAFFGLAPYPGWADWGGQFGSARYLPTQYHALAFSAAAIWLVVFGLLLTAEGIRGSTAAARLPVPAPSPQPLAAPATSVSSS
jgi:ABC-type dipeptide/oligopeptide/nickel transport system permease subunit